MKDSIEYRFFWAGLEFQLMSFPDEDLVDIFSSDEDESLTALGPSMQEDMRRRGITFTTLSINLSKE